MTLGECIENLLVGRGMGHRSIGPDNASGRTSFEGDRLGALRTTERCDRPKELFGEEDDVSDGFDESERETINTLICTHKSGVYDKTIGKISLRGTTGLWSVEGGMEDSGSGTY